MKTPTKTFPNTGDGMKQAADFAQKEGEPSISFKLSKHSKEAITHLAKQRGLKHLSK